MTLKLTERDFPSSLKRNTAQRSRHDRLRREMAPWHASVEAAMDSGGAFSSLEGFARYLSAAAPLYAAIERNADLAGAERLFGDWQNRRKAKLFSREPSRDPCVGSGPTWAHEVAGAWCDGDVLGALYVLEGATLGGAVLSRHLRKLAGGDEVEGLAVLDPYGERRGEMWRSFLEQMNAHDLSVQAEAAMTKRARQIFVAFQRVGEGLRDRVRAA